MDTIYNPTVTVCSKCLKACCWQGEFMCDDAYDASTVERKISTLIKNMENGHDGEHPDWWNKDLYTANKELLTVKDLRKLGMKGKIELSKI